VKTAINQGIPENEAVEMGKSIIRETIRS
jgi:hypothetical protein